MIELKSVKKKYTEDGYHSISPDETVRIAVQRLRRFGKGVYHGLQDLTPYNSLGLPAYRVIGKARQNEWGKGMTPHQAQASALMERIERISSVISHRESIDKVRSPFKDLSEEAISKRMFGLSNIHHVLFGEEKIDEVSMDWVKACSLISKKDVMVPAQHVYLGFSYSHFPDRLDSNGLASGNTMEEAILQALGEVIERHVHHILYFNRPRLKRLDLSTISNARLKALVERLEKEGYFLLANDASLDLGLNSIACFLYHPKHEGVVKKYLKVGTSTSPEIALIRAITEAAQNLSVSEYRGQIVRDSKGFSSAASDEDKSICDWFEKNDELISIEDIRSIACGDFFDEINIMTGWIRKKGYDLFAYDLTHPKINIPVVRVMVPGLQPNFLLRGLGPYDKDSCVTPHLAIYQQVMEKVLGRELANQKISEES